MKTPNVEAVDLAIIGGGVVGCAVARAVLLCAPQLKVRLIEKEPVLAAHQSGRNSGVVHVGYNQKPGTLKAQFVVDGSRRLRQFCKVHNISLVENGILLVARNAQEVETLRELLHRGRTNGAMVEWVDEEGLRTIEPHTTGLAGLFAPEGASVDSAGYVRVLADEARSLGAEISTAEAVEHLKESSCVVSIRTTRRQFEGRVVVNAGGLHADRLAHQMGVGEQYRIIPFKGQYYELIAQHRHLVRSHIYPTPDLAFPFLGVHFSRTVDGHVKVGPGSMLAMGRESYERRGWNPRDLRDMIAYPGFWRLWRSKAFRRLVGREWRKSISSRSVWTEARRLIPELPSGSLIKSRCGIRAQLVSMDGYLVDDLLIEETPHSLHILNAVSPALTCSLPYAELVASRIVSKL